MVDLKIQLPEGFLDEEERCGYRVSAEMKKAWAVMLDLFAEFDRVCKKHNITYFASGGTKLGAVRHKGFIPWDDDMDLMMMRDQYEKLCSIAPSEFQHPYFFQTEYTDFGSLRGHAQLRNSMTTAILENERDKNYRFNQGIFIDIFPLDSVIDDSVLFEKQRKLAKRYRRISYFFFGFVPGFFASNKKGIVRKVKKCIGILFKKPLMFLTDYYYKKFEETCKAYDHKETVKISLLSLDFDNPQLIKYRADFRELIEVKFEFLKVPLGANYHHALSVRYGENYNEYVIGTTYHCPIFFDADRSYLEYINK